MGKRIAITGANGQLGQTLMRSALFEQHVLLPLGRVDMDISDQAQVSAKLDSLKPDIIINAAAYTAVDAAESQPEEAYSINEQG
jgi:dTDP-4-dehydrorhamnose reductase